ncbi:MAG: hypothetical protein RIF33_24050 [Cyclobacteriaceae bacterium]
MNKAILRTMKKDLIELRKQTRRMERGLALDRASLADTKKLAQQIQGFSNLDFLEHDGNSEYARRINILEEELASVREANVRLKKQIEKLKNE